MCKKLIKNSHPFGKKCQKTAGGIFDSHFSCYIIIINVPKSLLCDEQCKSMSYRPRTTLTGNINAVDSYTLEKTANDLLSEIKFC